MRHTGSQSSGLLASGRCALCCSGGGWRLSAACGMQRQHICSKHTEKAKTHSLHWSVPGPRVLRVPTSKGRWMPKTCVICEYISACICVDSSISACISVDPSLYIYVNRFSINIWGLGVMGSGGVEGGSDIRYKA